MQNGPIQQQLGPVWLQDRFALCDLRANEKVILILMENATRMLLRTTMTIDHGEHEHKKPKIRLRPTRCTFDLLLVE